MIQWFSREERREIPEQAHEKEKNDRRPGCCLSYQLVGASSSLVRCKPLVHSTRACLCGTAEQHLKLVQRVHAKEPREREGGKKEKKKEKPLTGRGGNWRSRQLCSRLLSRSLYFSLFISLSPSLFACMLRVGSRNTRVRRRNEGRKRG